MNSNDKDKSRVSWLLYGGEILTIFFALAVLTGRIYTLSYWNVFGLPPELSDTAFIDYAIVSPNTTLASMFMAVGTVAMIACFRRQPYDFVGNSSPKAIGIIGWLAFCVGVFTIGIITKVDSSKWTIGTVGIAFGLGYFLAIGGEVAWAQAALKQQKELSKLEKILFGWLKKVSIILVQIIIMIGLVSASLWAIVDTAQKFGANEAKMMISTGPDVTIQLDSPKGFEDLAFSNTAGAVLLKVRIITEAGGFLYVSPGVTITPPQIYIRAIPVSRVQSIQYSVGATPLGE
jgi:hypothetical protein